MTDINSIWEGWHAEELLGQGAYGKVYRMSRSEFGHTSYAAAKLIEIPQDASEIASLANMGMDNLSIQSYFESTARNIVNEIAVMESLKGARNVVAIEDYRLVEHEDSIGWTICIRMELLQSLTDYQKENGSPSVDETMRIGVDICNALICCEDRGVIHRDVKPENIFRSAFGDYKLGDFGISRQIESSTKSVYSQKGTGPYMAPEVVRGQKYNSNVDVYSLGIMLYRYLNKMRFPFLPPAPQPFTADDMEQALLRRLRGDELPAPSEANQALGKIVCRACDADAGKRYQSARDLREDLLSLQDGRYQADEKEEEAVERANEDPSQRIEPNGNPHESVLDERLCEVEEKKCPVCGCSVRIPVGKHQCFCSVCGKEVKRSEGGSIAHAKTTNGRETSESTRLQESDNREGKLSAGSMPDRKRTRARALKILLSLIGVFVIVSVVAALGSSGNNDGQSSSSKQSSSSSEASVDYTDLFAGTWDLVEMREGDDVTDSTELEALRDLEYDVYVILFDDGTSNLVLFDDDIEGTWKAKSKTKGTIKMEGQEVEMTLVDESHLMFEQEGASLTFERDEDI